MDNAPKLDDIPFPEYEGDVEKILKIYETHWKRIEEEVLLLSELPESVTKQRLIRQRQATIARLTLLFYDLRKALNESVEPMITDAYLSGLAYTAVTSGAVATSVTLQTYNRTLSREKRRLQNTLRPSRQRYIDLTIRDLQTDLLKATKNTEKSVKAIVRESFAKVMSEETLRFQKRSVISKKIRKEITKRALRNKLDKNVAIIDKAGRRWGLTRYVNMAVRTKANSVYFDGIRQEAKERGMDLAVINTHPLTTDACVKYQGMIISLNGDTKGFKTYEELKASKEIFHPMCRHFARPVPSLEFVPKAILDEHKKQMKRLDKKK